MSKHKPLEITCWRAKFLGAIRIGRWEHGVFKSVAEVPVRGEFVTARQLRKAEELRRKLEAAGA
ncbi:MAG: hypothetical protein KGL39_44320 [Patescibacteria group bacterium]|nr:hypothetical protein [Patescibacteria group bacterium]